jgi:hypothetical protein
VINKNACYSDLHSDHRLTLPLGQSTRANHAPVLPQYFSLAAGTVLEPFLRRYLDSAAWELELRTLVGRIIVFGPIVGITILPAVYESSFDRQKLVASAACRVIPLGIGWQPLFTSVTKISVG